MSYNVNLNESEYTQVKNLLPNIEAKHYMTGEEMRDRLIELMGDESWYSFVSTNAVCSLKVEKSSFGQFLMVTIEDDDKEEPTEFSDLSRDDQIRAYNCAMDTHNHKDELVDYSYLSREGRIRYEADKICNESSLRIVEMCGSPQIVDWFCKCTKDYCTDKSESVWELDSFGDSFGIVFVNNKDKSLDHCISVASLNECLGATIWLYEYVDLYDPSYNWVCQLLHFIDEAFIKALRALTEYNYQQMAINACR